METSVQKSLGPFRYYTPWQITVAPMVGGSLAGGFLAMRNHLRYGAPSKATVIIVVSVIVGIVAIIAGAIMPPHASRSAGAILIIIAYRWYAESAFAGQISNRKAEEWTRYSWWQVIGISVAFLVGMLVLLFLGIQIFDPDKQP